MKTMQRLVRARQVGAGGGVKMGQPMAGGAYPGVTAGTMAAPTGQSPTDVMPAARAEAELAQLRAISSPPPMRMTTFASGANNFYTPDVSAYTGAQRQAFLPNESKQVGDFGQTESAQRDAVRGAWAYENPGEGPYTGSYASQVAMRAAAEEAARKAKG
jgi:hypothetical protein